ncbi:MAG: ABC transporter ATP-binding protein [Lachnospiraceae bacterium]|nr:ABC transporter ATP-binding protein [Lachnospiraceae bacterium]
MIRTNDLVKTFDGFTALDKATLHVKKGSVYGLVGPNGAGKSTIIRSITGVYKQDSGEILIDGQKVFDNNDVKQRMAYIPDDVFYYHVASLKDMAKFYADTYKTFDMNYFMSLAQYFPKIDMKKKMRFLSKGMQKQAAFWLAIAQRPEVLILDEPVDGLDPVMRHQVWSLLLKEVADRGVTVLVSSHNLRELEDVCDHVGIMADGKVILECSLEDMQENTVKVQMAFDGEIPDFKSLPNVLHATTTGRVVNLIIKDHEKNVVDMLAGYNPMFMETIPLTLEEIFIYELGGTNYASKDILIS